MTERLLDLVKPYWVRLVLAMVCMAVVAGVTALMAYLVKPVLDDIFFQKSMATLSLLPPFIILLYIVKGGFGYGQSYLMSFVGQRIVANLREQLYRHLQRLSLSYFDRTSTGLLMSRIINDVNLIQGAVSSAVTGILKDLFTIIGLVVVIFYRDWQLAGLAILVLPIAVLPIVKFGRKLRKISTQSQKTMAAISIHLHETLSGNRIVKAFGMEDREVERFQKRNQTFFDLTMKDVSVKSMSSPIMEFLGGIGIAAIIWYGGYNVIRGTSTPGTFFSFLTALLMLYEPIKHLSGVNNTIQQGMAAAVRVFEILDLEPEIQDQPGATPLQEVRQGIVFQDVSFRYDREWVLRHLNLEVQIRRSHCPGRHQRRRENDPGQPHPAFLREDGRGDPDRRPADPVGYPGLPARADRYRDPANHPLQRHSPQQYPLWIAPKKRGGDYPGGPGRLRL